MNFHNKIIGYFSKLGAIIKIYFTNSISTFFTFVVLFMLSFYENLISEAMFYVSSVLL